MNGQLSVGTILTSSKEQYKVIALLGSGGQGEVYDVESSNDGCHYAVKWYYKDNARTTQRNILDNLIKMGAPNDSFLWPQDIVVKSDEDSFGYLMPLRTKNFKSIVDMMKRRVDPSFSVLCRVAFNLTKGYLKLHEKGYCYRDVSFGNVFFDPDSGDVLICDNDNVSVSGADDSAVCGTPRFMAPEVVKGIAQPSRNTDLFSLAVLLFYIFMLGHPLEGKLEADIHCLDSIAMNKLYGTHPVFVFDPTDKTNRPVKGYQDNVLLFWDLYPQQLKDLFIRSFTDGLTRPETRVTEKEWLKAFSNLIAGIYHCPKCGSEVFYDDLKTQKGIAHMCWSCQSILKMPIVLAVGNSHILMLKNTVIYSHYLNCDYNLTEELGRVIRHPILNNVWGIRNESNINWIYTKTDGQQTIIPKGKSAVIARGVKINFGASVGEFK